MFQGFQFPKTILNWLEMHPGTAGWAQAIVAALAIIAVYYAATIPVKAEARGRARERKLRADGMALLLHSDIIVLKGEIEAKIESGNIYQPPVPVPPSLLSRADDLYLLAEAGGLLLQAIGAVNGVAAQTLRFQREAMDRNGSVIQSLLPAGIPIWQNNINTLKLCIMNLDEAIERIATRIGPKTS
jgi:hypothetical protein